MSDAPVSRRHFLAGASTLALGAMIVPRHVLGGPGYQAPSDTLNIAIVGAGGMGMQNAAQLAGENIVALCDIDFGHVDRQLAGRLRPRPPATPPDSLSAAQKTAWLEKRRQDDAARAAQDAFLGTAYAKAARFADYREMLDRRKDIDAVIVATPDHMHAAITERAMRARKHVYVQKPLTYTVEEARRLARVAGETRVVTQMGNQGHSGDGTRRIRELVQSGVLGPVREVHVWTDRPVRYWKQGVARPTEATAPPEGVHWDLFLGVGHEVPYSPGYHPFAWRGWTDWGVGAIGDMGAHLLDQPVWALDLGLPTAVSASSTPWGGPAAAPASYPVAMNATLEFAARGDRPPVALHWSDGGLLPSRPAFLPDDVSLQALPGGGGVIVGARGILVYETYGNNPTVYPASLAEEAARVPTSVPRIAVSHERNWVDACKQRATASAPFDYAAPLTEIMLLPLIAARTAPGGRLAYDARAMAFPGSRAATALLTREYRAGWSA